jgi:hypothetical protein
MATARNSSRKRPKILLFPTDEQIRTWLGRLPKFEAHDLRSIINEVKANGNENLEIAFVLALRRRNEEQMNELLRRLEIDPSKSNAWQRGFFRLANLHHGLGQLAWYPRRTNTNASTWTSDFGAPPSWSTRFCATEAQQRSNGSTPGQSLRWRSAKEARCAHEPAKRGTGA